MTLDREEEQAGRRYRVRGRVQGVGFRHFVWRRARAIGLAGWVRNLPDGSVEIEAAGVRSQLASLERAITTGPPMARVERVDTEEVDGSGLEAQFQVRP